MFVKYDAERGAGLEAARRFVVRGYPTLVVLDAGGRELERQLGYDKDELHPWLRDAARRAVLDDRALDAELRKHPGDLALLWAVHGRARARGDRQGQLAALARIEAAAGTAHEADGARAGALRLEEELRGELESVVRTRVAAFVAKHPGAGSDLLGTLAATRTDPKTLDRLVQQVVAAAPNGALNELTYEALRVGAYDAALVAAKRQLDASPTDPNSFDTLAEVHNFRGEKQKAVELERKGLSLPGVPASLAQAMRDNLARFERGERDPAIRAPELAAALGRFAPPASRVVDPRQVSERWLREEAPGVIGKCAGPAKASGLRDAVVRITLGPAAHPAKVELLEPSAPAPLRKCLEEALGALAVPPGTAPVRTLVTLPIGS